MLARLDPINRLRIGPEQPLGINIKKRLIEEFPSRLSRVRKTCFSVVICYVGKSNTLTLLIILQSALAYPERVTDWLSLAFTSSRGAVASYRACPVASPD